MKVFCLPTRTGTLKILRNVKVRRGVSRKMMQTRETRVSNFFAEWTSQGSFGRNQIQTTQTATLGRFSFFPSGFDPGERYSVDSATPRNTEQHPESHPQQFCLSSLSRIGWCCGAWACRSREREKCLTPDQVSLPAHMFLR